MLIGEVSRRSGVSARMLRHYEKLGLIAPNTEGAYRDYSEENLQRIAHIEALRSLGLPLKQVGAALADPTFQPGAVLEQLITETRERIAQERELLGRLRAVRDSAATTWEDALEIVELLNRLRSPDPARRQRFAFQAASVDGDAAILARAAMREQHTNVAGAMSWSALQSSRWSGENSGEAALKIVAAGLKSSSTDVRQRAIHLLVSAPSSHSRTAHLHQAMLDKDADVRSLAALALAESRDESAVPELKLMVINGIRDVEAAEALILFPGGATLEFFRKELMTRAPMDEARARIAQALAEFPEARELLTELIDDPNPKVAFTARGVLKMRDGEAD